MSCAKTLVLPESGRGLKGNAQRSGQSLPVSLARLDPAGCWRKTYQDYYQATLDNSSEMFSGTWPRAGMMLNGIVYQQQPLAPLTGGTGCSLWPTPRALVQGMECTAPPYKGRSHGWDLGAAIQDAASMTPRVMWPTPTDASKGGGSSRSGDRINKTPTLQGMARKGMWPTPRGSMANGPSQSEIDAGNPKCRIETEVAIQTPGQLNAEFVEYLMNFPKGWTDLTE